MRSDNWTDETVPGRQVEPGHGEARGDDRSASLVRVWVMGFVALLLLLALGGLWGLYLLRGRFAVNSPTPTLILWTPTPAPIPTATATPTTTPTPPPPSVPPIGGEEGGGSGIAIGRYVQVANTGGYGLSLREGPGGNYTRMDVALDGETFVVVDGPTAAGDSDWWKLRDPENEERVWWAAGNFLELVEQP
jgi:hypothetical protein